MSAPYGYGAPPPGQPGYGGAPPPGQPGYGGAPQPGYGAAPPGQPGYGAPPPGQAGYGAPGYGAPQVNPQVMQWFQAVDSDRSGRISVNELQQALTNANWSHFNPETCRLMIGMFDRDHSGQIDMNEFQALWDYINQWKGVFDQYDRDRSGHIDSNELHNAFNTMGYRLSPQFAQLVITRFDIHARRNLSLDNFIQCCVMLKSITDTFRARDPQGTGQIRIGYEDCLTMVLLNKP